jgi:FkbM family methyltransferase
MALPIVKDCRHGKFMFLSTDDYVGKSLDHYGEYSEHEWNVYSQFIKERMLIIDGGANMGAFTIPFGKAVGPEGIVIAFEPQLTIYNILVGNIALNGLSYNTIPKMACLGAKEGEIDFVIADYDQVGNFGGLAAGRNPNGLSALDANGQPAEPLYTKVSVVTIDGMNLKGLSLLKLDIEGMERDAILGGIETIKEYKPVIYVENNNKAKSPQLIQTLFDLEYSCWWDISPLENRDNYFEYPDNLFGGCANINMLCFHNSRDIQIVGGDQVKNIHEWETRFPGREG